MRFATRNNARTSKPPPRFSLCSRTGHTAQGYKEDVVTKRDQKTGGQQTSFKNNREGDGGGSDGGINLKHRNYKGGSPTDGRKKSARPGCFLCEGSHKCKICRGGLDPAAAPAADGSMHGGYISVTHSDLGIALFASIDTSLVLITNTCSITTFLCRDAAPSNVPARALLAPALTPFQSDTTIGLSLMDRFTSAMLDFFQRAMVKEDPCSSEAWR